MHATRSGPARAPSRAAANWRVGVIVAVTAVVLFFVASGIETAAIRIFGASENELEWVSDLVLSLFFGTASFLWLRLRQTRATLSMLERERIVLDTQLDLAAQIQRAYLPPVPADEAGLRWAARLEQAWQIGGDLYDFVRIGDSWIVVVGDVAGKGVPAALVTASIRTHIRTMSGETLDPGELVARLSKSIHDDHGGMPYFTCVVLRIDERARNVTYVNAGHPAAMVLPHASESTPRLLESTGLPAGLFARQQYETHPVELRDGAMLVILTDGVTDALSPELTWAETAAALMRETPRHSTPSEICDALIDRTSAALEGQDWTDDRTIVAIDIGW